MLFSWGANAQETMVKVTGPVTTGAVKGMKSVKVADRVSAGAQARTAARAAAKAPAGTAASYWVYDDEAVYGFYDNEGYQLMFPRMRQMELVFGDGGKVYVPNFILTSLLGSETYIEGALDASGNIVIESGQLIGSVSQSGSTFNFYIYKIDPMTGAQSSGPITLTLDPDPKTYYLPENEFVGAFIEQGGQMQLYTYMMNLQLTDKAEITAAGLTNVKYDYSYDELTDAEYPGKKGTVETWQDGEGNMVTTTIMPVYEDAMFNLSKAEGTGINFYSGFVVEDDLVAYAIQFTADGGIYTAENATFAYNAATDSYELPADNAVGALFAMEENGRLNLYINCYYTNASLKQNGTSGISAVETAGKGAAVAVEYYDLSGRRVSAAAQGVSIRVEIRRRYEQGREGGEVKR